MTKIILDSWFPSNLLVYKVTSYSYFFYPPNVSPQQATTARLPAARCTSDLVLGFPRLARRWKSGQRRLSVSQTLALFPLVTSQRCSNKADTGDMWGWHVWRQEGWGDGVASALLCYLRLLLLHWLQTRAGAVCHCSAVTDRMCSVCVCVCACLYWASNKVRIFQNIWSPEAEKCPTVCLCDAPTGIFTVFHVKNPDQHWWTVDG